MEQSNLPSKGGSTDRHPKNYDAATKKMLEKMYARVFDLSTAQKGKTPALTEEGEQLIAKTSIKLDDLVPLSLDEFIKREARAAANQQHSQSPKGRLS